MKLFIAYLLAFLLISGLVMSQDVQNPADPAQVDGTQVDPAVVDPAAVDPTVVEPAPEEPAPEEPAPVEPAPVDPTVVDPAPVEPTPVDGTQDGEGEATEDSAWLSLGDGAITVDKQDGVTFTFDFGADASGDKNIGLVCFNDQNKGFSLAAAIQILDNSGEKCLGTLLGAYLLGSSLGDTQFPAWNMPSVDYSQLSTGQGGTGDAPECSVKYALSETNITDLGMDSESNWNCWWSLDTNLTVMDFWMAQISSVYSIDLCDAQWSSNNELCGGNTQPDDQSAADQAAADQAAIDQAAIDQAAQDAIDKAAADQAALDAANQAAIDKANQDAADAQAALDAANQAAIDKVNQEALDAQTALDAANQAAIDKVNQDAADAQTALDAANQAAVDQAAQNQTDSTGATVAIDGLSL